VHHYITNPVYTHHRLTPPPARLTVPQIVAHPWIALPASDGGSQTFLTDALPLSGSPKAAAEGKVGGSGARRAETPLPVAKATATTTSGGGGSKRPSALVLGAAFGCTNKFI